MAKRKLLVFSAGLFVIIVWIWGSATLALSETLKCTSETKLVVNENEQAASSYYIGVNSREGSATCENGETATVKSYALWESNWPKEIFVQEYTIYTFKDFSTIITKGNTHQVPDPNRAGEAAWFLEGTAEIIKGANRFSGIKGSVALKGKQLPPDRKIISELTITYTLPPK